MSLPNELLPAGLIGYVPAVTGYNISRSLRFNSPDSAYLSRTPSAAGNRKVWTWAGWVKRSGLGVQQTLFSCYFANDNNSILHIAFASDNTLGIAGWSDWFLRTAAVYRDTAAWMHICIAVDTTAASASNRILVYVNGQQVTSFSLNTVATWVPQNSDLAVNTANAHNIGYLAAYNNFLSGYLADVHLVDGQALTPTSFGQFDSNGVWQPKAYSGTYGTNGFRLDFSDNSNTTAATLGSDRSGNGNNWTPNNFSVTAGAGNDSLVDSPTNYGTDTGAGGEVRGNYATLSPITVTSQGLATLSNGNLDSSGSGSSYTGNVGTVAVSSGKWYWESTIGAFSNGSVNTGIINSNSLRSADGPTWGFGSASDAWLRTTGGTIFNNGGNSITGLPTLTTGDILSVALDVDSGKLWFGKNGVWDQSGNPATGTNPTITFSPSGKFFYPCVQGYVNSGTWANTINFGSRSFAYPSPSGFKALCSQNLPTPTIPNGRTAMDVVTYTGTGSPRSITGLAFSPDLVWIKSRTNPASGYYHFLVDAVRGSSSGYLRILYSNTTEAEDTYPGATYGGVSSLDSTGFSLDGSSNPFLNNNTTPYVAWAWDAGTTTVTNTAGTITSQVRANASAGISIVSWTGTTTGTIGHGLGVAPSLIIAKSRSSAATGWIVYSKVFGTNYYLILNQTDAVTYSASYWGSSDPSSSTFGVIGTGFWNNNGSMIAYCFAPVSGFSAFGSYMGNGSADGPFVFCNFSPKWVMVKCTSASGTSSNWVIHDRVRNTYNVMGSILLPNLSNAEMTDTSGIGYALDFLSNGFKIRTNNDNWNTSSGTYIYAAFASNPFLSSRAQ